MIIRSASFFAAAAQSSNLRAFKATTHEHKVVFVIMIRAHWNGEVIAESDDTVVVEGSHYFPIDSVRSEFLQSSTTTTTCPWKGRASYYSLVVAGKENLDAAWFYPEPSAEATNIQGRVAFWRDVTIENEA